MKIQNSLKLFRNLLFALIIICPVIFSSCYTDYTLETDNYDVVGSFYNPDYNFNNVTDYYLIDSVIHRDGGTITTDYDNTILSTTIANLNALGWRRVTDSTGSGVVVVGTFVTSTTYVVNTGSGCWYDYWGYSWCYPYYGNTYDYSTGTVGVAISDLRNSSASNLPIEWIGVGNGLIGQGGNTTSRITTSINQAFAQSPYLKKP